ncbi:hypothetical protein [Aureispira anguillae]|uniref:Uncharacterized protein n=1 Tax=Aureispira anguillae TaxID=2864201 RepID=A0A915YGH2_9BACT|nr:hypothetical protein [Aureispira anguillae]BDS12725.1 hypothetical protein AsAng_0034500 [Aureispira anguillae]
MSFNSLLFTDEIEIEANKQQNQNLVIYFNGIYIDDLSKLPSIKTDFELILEKVGKKGFHAHKAYKNKADSKLLMQLMTTIILKYELHWFSFPFVKEWLTDSRLNTYMENDEITVPFKKSNYRASAFYFYLHCINERIKYLPSFSPKVRLYSDKDTYIRLYHGFEHDGNTLNNIEKIIGSKGKDEPILYLADHVGYLFRKVKLALPKEGGINQIKINPSDKDSELIYDCVKHIKIINSKKLFHYLDFWNILT